MGQGKKSRGYRKGGGWQKWKERGICRLLKLTLLAFHNVEPCCPLQLKFWYQFCGLFSKIYWKYTAGQLLRAKAYRACGKQVYKKWKFTRQKKNLHIHKGKQENIHFKQAEASLPHKQREKTEGRQTYKKKKDKNIFSCIGTQKANYHASALCHGSRLNISKCQTSVQL